MPTIPPSSRRRARGFTLIELMIVIVIMGLLVGLVGANVWHFFGDATRDTARMQMKRFTDGIEMYRARHRTIPKTLDELTLRGPQSPEPLMKKIPLDPWGQPYEYRILDESKATYEIVCSGPDKQPGTEDDLVEPEPERDR